MRTTLLFLFVSLCINAHSQTILTVFDSDVKHGLFYDLVNPMTFSSPRQSSILFIATEGAIVHKINNWSFTVQPKSKNTVTLIAIDSVKKDTLLKQLYKVRNIPMPDLSLGNALDSNQINLLPNALVSWEFQEFVPTTCEGHVLRGEVIFQNYTFSFNGDRIPTEIVTDLYRLKRVHQLDALPIELEVIISCASCVSRRITRTYFLI